MMNLQSVLLGIVGAVACLFEIPILYANKIVQVDVPEKLEILRPSSESEEALIEDIQGGRNSDSEDDELDTEIQEKIPINRSENATNKDESHLVTHGDSAHGKAPHATPVWEVAIAFAILAVTAGIGIVITGKIHSSRL